jgi:hypothetical protein
MAPPPPLQFAARWAHTPGLRARLWAQAAAARLPLLGLGLAATFVLHGTATSLRAVAAVAAAVGLLQAAAGAVAALVIVPAGGRTHALLAWLHARAVAHRLLGGQLAPQLQPLVQLLEGMRARLPAAREALLAQPGVERLQLTTPDGVVLDGYIAGRTGAPAGAPQRLDAARRPVLLYLCGNGEHAELAAGALLATAHAQRGAAVCLVNYRSVGASGGVMSRDGAVLDAATALSYLVHACGFAPARVVVLGHSIGGAFGAEAARCFPGALLVHDRSFSRLSEVALFHVAGPWAAGPLAASPWGTLVRALVRGVVRHVAAWELDAAAHWEHVSARVLVYSPADRVIPLPAQMAAARGLVAGGGGGCEPPPPGAWGEPAGAAGGGAEAAAGEPGTCVLRLGGAAGADQHNRALSPDEERRLWGAIDDHVAGRSLRRAA